MSGRSELKSGAHTAAGGRRSEYASPAQVANCWDYRKREREHRLKRPSWRRIESNSKRRGLTHCLWATSIKCSVHAHNQSRREHCIEGSRNKLPSEGDTCHPAAL